MSLTAVFMKVPEGYIAFVEELPGANTQGRSLEEARGNLSEAMTMVLDANRALSEQSPGRRRGHSGDPDPARGMKRIDLMRHLEQHGCELLREGSNHTDVRKSPTRRSSAVPRHRKVNDFLARKICDDLLVPRP